MRQQDKTALPNHRITGNSIYTEQIPQIKGNRETILQAHVQLCYEENTVLAH